MWKQFVNDYLGFSKKERNGIAVLLFLIIVFTTLPTLLSFFIKTKSKIIQALQKRLP
jgi:hypothetical protein